jgi:hypothetical protein
MDPRVSLRMRHCNDVDGSRVDTEKHDVWEALEKALSIWTISAPDRTHFGIISDGFESFIHDRNELDAKAGSLSSYHIAADWSSPAASGRTRSVRFIVRVG